MARITKPLTNTEVDKSKPKEKDYSLTDGNGLFLLVQTSGVKSWKFNYFRPISGKRTKITLGTYPAISLADARALREKYRGLLAKKIDPQIHQQEQELAQQQQITNTFRSVAENWRAKRANDVEPLTMEKNWQRLEKYIFSKFGDLPVTHITPLLLVETLKPLDAAGKSDTLHRLIRLTNQILNYAVNTGALQFNYCEKVREAFSKKPKQNNPAIRPDELPQFLSTLYHSNRDLVTKILIQWELLTMVRPAEAVSVEWSEIDWEGKLWNIPAEKMKKTRKGANPHTVPLSTQALAILEKMKTISGDRRFVFAHYSKRDKPMSKETASSAIRKIGYEGKQTAHGLRAVARTWLAENGVSYEVAEACLAHSVGSEVSLVYNRTTYLEQRKPVMQAWGDYVEQCSIGSTLAK